MSNFIHYGGYGIPYGGYGIPYTPPTPAVTRSQRITTGHTWIGWDGTVWPISDPSSGVFLVKGGMRGLGMPTHTRFTDESPALAGSRHRGSRVLERDVYWPLHLFSDAGSAEWVERDRAFWASLHRDKPGVWRVKVGSSVRELACRLVEAEDVFARDPVWYGWNTYGVRMVAVDPFWRGPWVVRQFDNTASTSNFFGPSGFGPPFFISSSSQLSKASIANPGNEPSYLVYVLHGPFDEAKVGIGDPGAITEYLSPVPAGQSVVIDTRPTSSSTARLIATPTADPESDTATWEEQVFTAPGASAFAGTGLLALNSPLQPGQERSLSLSMVGAGSMTVAHRPPFNRAW